MSAEWEQYRDRYAAERQATFDAYVDVWLHEPEARRRFSGWALFSQCASAEPAKRRDMPDRVRQAERIMQQAGYEISTPSTRGARRWVRKTR